MDDALCRAFSRDILFSNNTMNKKIILASSFFILTTSVTFAEKCKDATACITGFGSLIDSLNSSVVTALGTLFLAASVVGFLMGVVRFIWAQQQGDEKGVKSGKETLKWGIIALFCAFSIYGIIKFMQNTLLPVEDPSKIVVPRLKIEGGTQTDSGGRVPVADQGRVSPVPIGQNPQTVPVAPNSKSSLNGGESGLINFLDSSAGNTGSLNKTQTVDAQKIYNDCIGNGNSASECQGAYSAYGGTGNGQQSQALQAYDECKNAGNSEEECQAVYTAYGGSVE